MVAKKPCIVIIGAGMAGLTAAHRLFTSCGSLFDVSVMEAGGRIGGRILTDEFAGDRVEMGATWIHGIDDSPVYAIAEKINALDDQTRPWERMDGFPSNPVTVAEGGAIVDPSHVAGPVTDLYRRLMDAARAGEAPVDPKDPGVGPFLRQGLRGYQHSRDSSCCRGSNGGGWTTEELEEAVFAMHENMERTCTSADDLKELDLAAEGEYRDYPGDQITIAKGYSCIVKHLADALPPGTVNLGRHVHRIEWCPGGDDNIDGDGRPVKLHFEGEHSAMTADHVIVTVSLGVLKASLQKGAADAETGSLSFSPALPPFKREAITRLGFGLVNKLFMEMDLSGDGEERRFPFLQMAFAREPEKRVQGIPWWMRRTAFFCPIYGSSRVLLAWFAGAEAMELEALGDDEVFRGVATTLNAFFPSDDGATAPGRIGRLKRSGWGRDTLFLGSYSYVAVGSSGDDLDVMAEPLPRRREEAAGAEATVTPASTPPPPALQILFAGEATHRTHYSTTHGAYLSGIREADRLLRHYHVSCIKNGTPPPPQQ